MKYFAISTCIFLAGCSSSIKSVPVASQSGADSGAFVYMLPKGMVSVIVFADAKGVGITIEPAEIFKDSRAGGLVVSAVHSMFSKEQVEIKATGADGLLSMVMFDSEAQILEIVEAAANSAARISLQNAKAQFLSEKVVLQSVLFDPLSPDDVKRASNALCRAVSNGFKALKAKLSTHRTASGICDGSGLAMVSLSVAHTDGNDDTEAGFPSASELELHCAKGVCARTMTTRLIRISMDGVLLASHAVDIPTRNVVAVSLEHSVLADRKTTVTVSAGILKEYKVEKESELLTVVKAPGKAIGGFLTGITDQLTAEKTVADKQKALYDSQAEAAKSAKALETTTLKLHSTSAESGAAYTARSLTVYPYHMEITELLKTIEAQRSSDPNITEDDADLTSAPPPANGN